MAKRDQLLSDLLLDRGLWPDFVQHREALIAKGVKKTKAHKQSLDYFLPVESKQAVDELLVGNGGCKEEPETKGDTDAEARLREQVALSEAEFEPSTDLVDPEKFRDDEFSLDSVKWVLSNLYVKVDPSEAPNALAWSTLQHFRFVPADAGKALVQFLGKFVPAKVEEERADSGPIDGAVQLRLIRRVRAAGKKLQGSAKAARRVHNSKVTGSSPVPATSDT